jgi:hypothetical protein
MPKRSPLFAAIALAPGISRIGASLGAEPVTAAPAPGPSPAASALTTLYPDLAREMGCEQNLSGREASYQRTMD